MVWGKDEEAGIGAGGSIYATGDAGLMNAEAMQNAPTSTALSPAELNMAQNRITQIAEEVRRQMPGASENDVLKEIVQRSQGQVPPNMDVGLVTQYAQQAATQTDMNIMNNTPGGSAQVTQQEEQKKEGIGTMLAGLFSGAVGIFALKHANEQVGGKLTPEDDVASRATGYDMLVGGNVLSFNDFSSSNPHVKEAGLEAALAEGASRAAAIGRGQQQQVARNDAGGGMGRSLNG